MASSTDSNRDSLSNPAPAALTPKPFQFGLKGLFALMAAVGLLVAGASQFDFAGFVLAAVALSVVGWFWAKFTGRRELGDWCSRLSVYLLLLGLLVVLLIPSKSGPRPVARQTRCLINLKNLGL